MDADTAKVLFREGATLIFLDFPEGSDFGIDYNSWTVGPNFRGVKMIPPGIHFVYYSAQDTGRNCGMRSGFFYDFKQREIVIKKWDKMSENIREDKVGDEEKERLSSNMKELDQYLGAYPYENYKKWVSLTNQLTAELVSRLQPTCGTISSVTQFLSPVSDSKMRKEAKLKLEEEEKESEVNGKGKTNQNKSGLPKLDTVPGTEIQFSKIPKQRYPNGSTPAEITKHSMDSSYILKTLIETHYKDNPSGILGEIQLAFICFLIGHKYEAFDQWKKLVHLLCSSEDALSSHTNLFMNFITMLHFQVHEIPEDFFVDIVSANNFLTTTLHEFFSNLEAGNGEVKLRRRGQKFKEHLTRKFMWDFGSEPDDYAPVIVDT